MRATAHFEQCVASTCQAAAFLDRINAAATPAVPPSEVRDDRETRLRAIWNRATHFDEDLVNYKRTDAEITAPVWLTDHGLSSVRASVTFDELHSFLTSLLDALKFLSEDLPRQVIARRQKEGEASGSAA